MAEHQAEGRLGELWANISQAAYEVAVAEVEGDDDRVRAAREQSATAVAEVIRLGEPISAVAVRETEGRRRATDELGKSLIKAAVASARKRDEANAAYERDVQRAGRLLSDREVAKALGVAPGTVRAIVRRSATDSPVEPDDETAGHNGDGEHSGADHGDGT